MDEKSLKCVFIGDCTDSKAYKLYNPATCKVIVSKDVVFREATRWNWKQGGESTAALRLDELFSGSTSVTEDGEAESSLIENNLTSGEAAYKRVLDHDITPGESPTSNPKLHQLMAHHLERPEV